MNKHIDSLDNHLSPALPAYTIGTYAYNDLAKLISKHGKKAYLIGGLNALNAGLKYVECEWMTREIGVAAVPGSSFFPDNSGDCLMRLHFARGEESLKEAISRLERLADL